VTRRGPQVRPVSFDPALGDVAAGQVHAAGIALLADLGEQLMDGNGGVGGAAGAQVITVGIHQRRVVTTESAT
jgi:hypothetical protein